MLEEIAQDNITSIAASNQPIFDTSTDYDKLVADKASAASKWASLSPDDQKAYGSLAKFETHEGVADLKNPNLIPAKNTSLLLREVRGRLDNEPRLQLLGIEPLDFDDSTIELAESLENIAEIRSLYKLRKMSVGTSKNAGISADEASRLRNCFSQGRELYLAGKNGSLMVKPLNFFYALTAYTYGIIILNNPLRFRKDMLPGSHGMGYLPSTIQAQFGGDQPRGTFSDLVTAFPTQLITTSHLTFNIDCSKSVIDFYNTRFDVSLGTLLSLIPEMADYYKLTTGRDSRCFPIETTTGNDPRSLTWEFHIGNGETRPSRASLDEAFAGFPVSERNGKFIVTVPAVKAASIKACIYTDLRGNLWYIDNPFFPIILPEVAVHFLITSMFSSIMRYRPDEWGSVLVNEVTSDISLLTRHYFSSFQRKFMLLVLRSISRYVPYAM